MSKVSSNSNESNLITYIIPHTHWDREWYVPFQYFRFRLVEMIDHLIDVLETNPKYSFFNLDCQTVLLEDYLEIKPENEKRLRQLIKAGKLGIGPWYVLASPWLQTGEGTIRNIMRGVAICKDFETKPQNVGYAPDQFIHPPQFPQIYKGLGIDYAGFGRGMANQYDENPKLTTEFWWEGLDGSKVLTFNFPVGYGLNVNLDPNVEKAVDQMAFSMAPLNGFRWSTNARLAFAGSDHCGADDVLPEAIEFWNNEEELVEEMGVLRIATWKDYIDHILKANVEFETIKGEIAGRHYQVAFHTVLSSYMNLKQRNFYIHDLLERWAEPWSTIGDMYGLPFMHGFLRTSWKWLLRNQPHDSSWTSSVDQVEKEMEIRFDWAEQIGIDVARRNLQWIVQHLDPKEIGDRIPIIIFNPHPWPRAGLIEARFENKFESSKFQLLDTEGNEITAQFHSVEKSDIDRERRRVYVGSHGPLGKKFYEVKFVASNIPPMGYKTYFISLRKEREEDFLPPEEGLLDGNDYYLENERIRVVVEENGSITLIDKESEHKFMNLHLFEDFADVGDGWEYISIENDKGIYSYGNNVKSTLIEASDFRGTLKIERELTIPKEAAPDLKERSKETITIPVITYLSIEKGNNPTVMFKTELINLVKDHRLRLLFPTKLKTDTILANGHFGVFKRSIKVVDGKGWTKPPQTIYPFHKFLDVWDDDRYRGLAILTRGLPEYDTIIEKDETLTVALTLFRSTGGWGRHINVKPPILTPNAQLIGHKFVFEYALIPHRRTWDSESVEPNLSIPRLVENYYTPLRWEESYDAYRYHIPENERTLPMESGLFEIMNPYILSSSFTKEIHPIENGNSPVSYLRVYNIHGKKEEVNIRFYRPLLEVKFCDLKNQPLKDNEQPEYKLMDIDKENNSDERIKAIHELSFSLEKYKIITIALRFA